MKWVNSIEISGESGSIYEIDLHLFAVWFYLKYSFLCSSCYAINLKPQEKFIIETANCFMLLKIYYFMGEGVELQKDFMLGFQRGCSWGG